MSHRFRSCVVFFPHSPFDVFHDTSGYFVLPSLAVRLGCLPALKIHKMAPVRKVSAWTLFLWLLRVPLADWIEDKPKHKPLKVLEELDSLREPVFVIVMSRTFLLRNPLLKYDLNLNIAQSGKKSIDLCKQILIVPHSQIQFRLNVANK